MLFELFPDAQFINLVRDPRAAVASQIPLGWGHEEAALASAAVRWEYSVRRVDGFAGKLRPDQLLDLRYEDMVRDPEATLEQVCAFAGLSAGDSIATMIEAERRGKFRPGWHEKLAQPISTDSVERWREKLDPHEVALVEQVAEPFLDRFGYRTASPGAVPTPADLSELKRQRRRRLRKWRRQARDEFKRRHVLYRRPVAAIRPPGWIRRLAALARRLAALRARKVPEASDSIWPDGVERGDAPAVPAGACADAHAVHRQGRAGGDDAVADEHLDAIDGGGVAGQRPAQDGAARGARGGERADGEGIG